MYASIPTDNAKTPRFPLDLDIKKMVDAETDTDLLTESRKYPDCAEKLKHCPCG